MSTTDPRRIPARLRRPASTAAQIVVPLLAVALLLTACSAPPEATSPAGGTTATTSPPAPSASSAAPAPSSTGTTTAAPASARPAGSAPSGSTPAKPRPVTACDPVELDLVLGDADSSAGNVDQPIVLSNRGHVPCTVSGAPHVRMIGADWNQLGDPAAGSGAPSPTVRLESGGSATAIVRIVRVGEDGGPLGDRCTTAPGIALLVETADERRGDPLDGAFRGCRETGLSYMSVTPFRLDA